MPEPEYIVIVQCDIVKERCSGAKCERAFHERTGGFADLPKDRAYRTLYMTCGGCCGRAIHRQLTHLVKMLKLQKITKDRIRVQLSSCITKDNYHGPGCPHLDYLKTLIQRVGIEAREDTSITSRAEARRKTGVYQRESRL